MVVPTNEPGTEMEVGLETEEDQSKKIVRWENFLPQMVLRVLLVEADDSTRHIIAALLRKCSYKGIFTLHFSENDYFDPD